MYIVVAGLEWMVGRAWWEMARSDEGETDYKSGEGISCQFQAANVQQVDRASNPCKAGAVPSGWAGPPAWAPETRSTLTLPAGVHRKERETAVSPRCYC